MAASTMLNGAALALALLALLATQGRADNDTGPATELNIDLNQESNLTIPLVLEDVIEPKGAPSIPPTCETTFPKDISKTRNLRQHCGVKDVDTCPCESPRYRTFNGQCNNPKDNALGSASTPFNRILKARYADGISKVPPKKNLPNPRALTTDLLEDMDVPDEVNSIMIMQWGQLIAHDVSERLDKTKSDGKSIDCCKKNQGEGRHKSTEESKEKGQDDHCLPIIIPKDDPFYSQFDRRCMNFVRSRTAKCPAKKGDHSSSSEEHHPKDLGKLNAKAVDQVNHVTSFLDLSVVYGSSKKVNTKLRKHKKGLLKSRKVKKRDQCTRKKELREFLPLTSKDFSNCISDKVCYMAGDDRVSTHLWLATLQTIFLREHNRLATSLQEMHKDWNDETVFQETRRIMIAVYQLITYKYFLPKVVGPRTIKKLNLFVEAKAKGQYSENVNPSTLNEFTSGAYRYLHSIIRGNIEWQGEGKCPIKSNEISRHFRDPSLLEKGNILDNVALRMTKQASQGDGEAFTKQIVDLLFRKKDAPFGDDLVAIDIQRGRDHGLPSYVTMREICGFPKIKTFDDLKDIIPEENILTLKKHYKTVLDLDFLIGGTFEEDCDSPALVGPTFACVIGEQFFRWRKGDRYFFDLEEGPGKFSKEQYEALHKVTLASILCKNIHGLKQMQLDPFMKPSDKNKLKKCSDIQHLDLKPWKDFKPKHNCPKKSDD